MASTRHPWLIVTVLALLGAVIAACGGDDDTTSDDGAADLDTADKGDESMTIGDRSAGPDDFVLVSNVTPGEVVIFADEAQAGLESVEDYLRDRQPEASADVQCWLIQREDGTIHQAMRCGPYVEPDGRTTWSSYPFASDDASQAAGRIDLRFESRLIGEVEPSMTSVELIRPDGLEAPEEAFDDVVEGTGTSRPEAPSECTATGSVTDETYGTFDLADAEYLEVTAVVGDNSDGYTYRHIHTLQSWDDDAGRGVKLSIRMVGVPGEEDVGSVTVDLDVSNRSIMEGGGSGNAHSVDQSELPSGLITGYDPTTGGPIDIDFDLDGRYSYEEPNPVTTDITITCEP